MAKTLLCPDLPRPWAPGVSVRDKRDLLENLKRLSTIPHHIAIVAKIFLAVLPLDFPIASRIVKPDAMALHDGLNDPHRRPLVFCAWLWVWPVG